MARPKRSQQINVEEAIKDTAWNLIAENGAAALSLRAIGRSLNITAPAIYNYYPRRDDLVTALIIDAYTSLGDSQLDALAQVSSANELEQLRCIGMAYRQWAVAYPQRYQLIFGAPLPGYHAPAEKTMPAAARSLQALMSVLDSARRSGTLKRKSPLKHSSPLFDQLRAWQQLHPVDEVYILYLALIIWSRVHGMVSLEIGNQYPAFIEDPGEIFHIELESILSDYLN